MAANHGYFSVRARTPHAKPTVHSALIAITLIFTMSFVGLRPAVASSAAPLTSYQVSATVPGLGEPIGMVLDPVNDFLYVTAAGSGGVSVVSQATNKIVGFI